MSAATKQTALNDIKGYIDSKTGDYNQWYAGIAAVPKKRVFDEHGVKHDWIWRECQSSDSARWVEDELLDLGCKGDTGGGDNSTKFVYAYKITNDTRE